MTGHERDIEDIDLMELAHRIKREFSTAPRGYLRAKTAARNAVVTELKCSELTAEELVDTMEQRALLGWLLHNR